MNRPSHTAILLGIFIASIASCGLRKNEIFIAAPKSAFKDGDGREEMALDGRERYFMATGARRGKKTQRLIEAESFAGAVWLREDDPSMKKPDARVSMETIRESWETDLADARFASITGRWRWTSSPDDGLDARLRVDKDGDTTLTFFIHGTKALTLRGDGSLRGDDLVLSSFQYEVITDFLIIEWERGRPEEGIVIPFVFDGLTALRSRGPIEYPDIEEMRPGSPITDGAYRDSIARYVSTELFSMSRIDIEEWERLEIEDEFCEMNANIYVEGMNMHFWFDHLKGTVLASFGDGKNVTLPWRVLKRGGNWFLAIDGADTAIPDLSLWILSPEKGNQLLQGEYPVRDEDGSWKLDSKESIHSWLWVQ